MPRFKFLSCTFFLLLFSQAGIFAQPGLFRDMNRHLQEKPKVSFSFDNRNTFMLGQNANIVGIRAGLEFNERVRIGAGIYGLNTDIPRMIIIPHDSIGIPPDTLLSQVGFSYLSLFTEYAFFKSKRWEFAVPLYLGLGSTSYRAGSYEYRKATVSLLETSLYGQFYVFSWLAFHAGAGYRLMLNTNPAVSGRFSGPVYTLGVKVYFGKLYRSVFPKKS